MKNVKTVKVLNFRTPKIFTVINLKFKQRGFSMEKIIQTVLIEWQTVQTLIHTCDTFLNPNREIWNFWSGNLCLVSGGFHVANFGLFLPKLKSRNLVTLLEICFRASQ